MARVNPETILTNKIRDHLQAKGWYTKKLHGSKFQHGLPDLLVSKIGFGTRFIEVKTPSRSRQKFGGLSPRQLKEFNLMDSAGCKIYIINDVFRCHKVLEGPPNWKVYALGGSKAVNPIGF